MRIDRRTRFLRPVCDLTYYALRFCGDLAFHAARYAINTAYHIARTIRSSFRSLCAFCRPFNLFVRFHATLLALLCSNAGALRFVFKPKSVSRDKKIKILHVTCSFDLGGTQRQIMNLCDGKGASDLEHHTVEMFPEHNFLYRRGLPLSFDRYIRGGFLGKALGRCVLSADARSLQIVQIYKLAQDIKAIKPDIVIGWGHEIAMLSFVAAAITRAPHIAFCIRTFDPSYGWTAIGDLIEKAHEKMFPYLSGIIVNSTALQHNYAQWLKIPREKIFVCPNGLSLHEMEGAERLRCRQEIRDRYNIPEDAIVIMNIGRFSKEKGQTLMIRAYKSVYEKYGQTKSIYCMLCGDGPTQGEIRAYIEQHSLHNAILAGRIADVHSYLSAADIFVMPSDFEGMPNAMMEAMERGLPCVSTNRTGALDIARDGREALYIDVGSVEQLTEKLSYLIENPGDWIVIGENARMRILEFSVPEMISCFNNRIRKIVRGGR